MAIRVEFEKTSVWNTGFVGEVFVYNETDETLPNYEVGFDLDAGITVVWNGVFEKTPEGRYLVVDDDDKNDIAPGEMVRFKFKAYGDDPAAAVPSGFTVNGTAVDLDPSVSPGLPVDPPPAEPVEPPETGPDGSIEVAAGTTVAEIQKLIGSAPAGSTIKLAPGTFVFDRPLEIERDDIAIIGSGEQQTKILMDFDEAPDHGIHVAGGATSSLGRLGADAGFDDRTIQVDGAGSIKAGDVLLLSQPNDDAWLDSIGDDSWRKDKPLRESLVKVESVSGDQVRLENGVHFDFEKGATTVSKIDLFENVELGGFTVEFPFGEADPAKLSNTMSDYNRFIAVRVDGTIGADVHDITVDQGPSMAFQFERALYLDADGLSAHGAHNKGSGGNGYAYQLRYTFDSELSNLEDSGMRHSLVFASWTSSVGNQAHVLQTDRDINFHGGRDHHNHVHVERSVRIPENDVMSNVTWFDEDGTRWGAPTDMTHNRATYDFVLGSKRDDIVEAADGGAYIDGRGANDVLIGGRGNDVLIGGAGRDHLIGGAGDDVAVYGSKPGDYKVSRDGDGIEVK
ncbi:MAG: cellulose binding domain-containing protein, partial [Geminicoccaceae bacterium]|nr:cellulose binding domain-containing protein [Geminicoccaceae bacterium]